MLNELINIFMSLNWFISMTFNNILHDTMFLSILFPIGLTVLPFAFQKYIVNKGGEVSYVWRISAFPFIYLIVGMVGACFAEVGLTNKELAGALIFLIYAVCFLFLLLFGPYAIYKNKSLRTLTVLYVFAHFYLISYICFIASMSIGGVWL